MFVSKPDAARGGLALGFLRVTVATLIFVHGVWRAGNEGNVEGFGGWLDSQGFPRGVYWAWAVTIYELVAPLFIIAGRFVTLACLGHVAILSLGAFMVHYPAGWFVVGAGRNGMEYSVLLIAVLAAVAWAYAPIGRMQTAH